MNNNNEQYLTLRHNLNILIFQITGIVILAVGIYMEVELYKYMTMSTDFSETASYVLIGTGTLIILMGMLACCCTVKGQPVLLFLVSCLVHDKWGSIISHFKCNDVYFHVKATVDAKFVV